jgi:hypothetical protein
MEDVVRRARAGIAPTPPEPVAGPVQNELAPSNGGPLLNPQERSTITPGHSDIEDVVRRERAGVSPVPETHDLGQQPLSVTPPPEELFPMFEEPGVAKPTSTSRVIEHPDPKPGAKLDSNYQIIDEHAPATAGAPTDDILSIVKRLLEQHKP